jgi:hypothetical protein
MTPMAIDYETLFGGADYDPCAALAAIRPAYMRMRVERSVQRVTFRDRTVEYHANQMQELGALVTQLESECAAKQGRARTRFAITAGARHQ